MIQLVHLTFVGANVPVASIDFGERLTLVRGPSDTGKSFIVDAIDFMLGARELKEIPEREGYSDLLLGIRLGGAEFTLMRSVTGGAFSVFDGRVTQRPDAPAERVLSHTHNANNGDNLSMWLLESIGLAGTRLRKNLRNETDSLSFRDVAHLVVVDETQMQSDVPPALTGRHISKTKEVSLLKLLLSGEDDSNLVASPSGRDERRLKGARLEVVDGLIADARERLEGRDDAPSIRDQLARLNRSVGATTDSIRDLNRARSDSAESLQRDQVRRRAGELRLTQISGLRARFGLLDQQYRSDIDRLDMIIDGGTLLGYFASDTCPLCGAVPEHQLHENFDAEAGSLVEAAGIERARTIVLVDDLERTFLDLDQTEQEVNRRIAGLDQRISQISQELDSLDGSMGPYRDDLSTYLRLKSELEATLSVHQQLAELERVRAHIEDEAVAETAAAAIAIGARVTEDFSAQIRNRLAAWGYEAASTARYDREHQDVYADNQFRSAHGKGVRSILHAAFTVALADYCISRDLPHPGFVVLDSPLITYRAPGEDEESGPNRLFATNFYQDMESQFPGQVIVMENTDPLSALDSSTLDNLFTKMADVGRYGYFLPMPEALSQQEGVSE